MADILANINKFVADELAKENIPADTKYAIIGTVNNDGVKIMAAVNIHNGERFKTKIAAIWDHDWDSHDNTIATKVIFTGK